MASKPVQEDSGPETPAWIVSFTDMITLLLAFFVLLQAFATEQDLELFRRGQGAFIRSIAGFGIPDLLFGKPQLLSGPTQKKRYPTKENDDKKNTERVIDPTDAQIREAFDRIKRVIETRTFDRVIDVTNVESTQVSFAPGSASLNPSARKDLRRRAVRYARDLDPKRKTICIIASAPDKPAGKDRWKLSALRAQVVSGFMRGVLSGASPQDWTLTPMGTGTVPPRHQGDSATERPEYIRIAIIGAE